MTSNYQVNGVDLDTLLAPLHSGWPTAGTTNDQVAGTDLDARYAPLSTGTAPAITNYQVNGVDLNEIFAAYGSTGIQVLTQPSNVSGSAAAGNPSGTVTSGSTTCAFTKGGGSYTYNWVCTGCTANSPTSATTTFSATVNAGTTTDASAYCTGSDGVTSSNTNTIAVTLTNTSPANTVVNATLVAGKYTTGTAPNQFTYTGYSSGIIGTFTVDSGSMPGGSSVNTLWSDVEGTTPVSVQFYINDGTTIIGQDGLISLQINGYTLTGSSATYSTSGSKEQWTWAGDNLNLVSGDSYPVILTFPA